MASNDETVSQGSIWSSRALYTTWLHVSCLVGTLAILAYMAAPLRGYWLQVSLKPLDGLQPASQARAR